MKLNLAVMSKHQHLLDSFFESLLPTIEQDTRAYVITRGLRVPKDDRIIEVQMDSFHPNKYFNQISAMINDDTQYLGIVNDDIVFGKGWLQDIRNKALSQHIYCISPGFVETQDTEVFRKRMEETKSNWGVTAGYFDAFYIFPLSIVDRLHGFDEEIVEWYDIDWYLRLKQAGYTCAVSNSVTVMHLGRQTLSDKTSFKARVKSEIIAKHGANSLRDIKRINSLVREYFSV